ncbi:hypothetical protein BG004_003367 [Podila humilis]|nr:hypothetical protein BG004_003367 [Podila humilis]
MTKYIPASSILCESAKGANYFLGIENGVPDRKDYVIFRRTAAISRPNVVAQEWNVFIRSLKICDSAHWRSQVAGSESLTKKLVSKWAMEMQDEAKVRPHPLHNPPPQDKEIRNEYFQVYFKEPELAVEHTLEGDMTGLRQGLKYFQSRSSELVVPGRDVSKCLPEALSINGILWIDRMPAPRPKECSSCLKKLREFFPPPLNAELQSLSLKVQAIIQSESVQDEPSEEELLESIRMIHCPNRQAVRIFERLYVMGKAEINEQIMKGIQNPRIMCVQVFGYEVVMYVMKMDQAGVYILYKAAEGYLLRSISDISGTENIISIFQHSKSILKEFQKELDTTVPHTDGSPEEPSLKAFVQKDTVFEKYKV